MSIASLINVVVTVCRRKKTKRVFMQIRFWCGFNCDQCAFTYGDIFSDICVRQKLSVTTKSEVQSLKCHINNCSTVRFGHVRTQYVDRCNRPTTNLKSVKRTPSPILLPLLELTIANVMRRSSHPSFIAERDRPHILPWNESVDKTVQTMAAARTRLPL